jgi:hypothetical protein
MATDASHRALRVEEIRAAIFENLHPSSLFCALLVSKDWSATGTRQLYRGDVPSKALRLASDEQTVYIPQLVRSLVIDSPANANRDTKGWVLPGLRRLVVTPEIAEQPELFAKLSKLCSSSDVPLPLTNVTFAAGAHLPAIAAGEFDGSPRYHGEKLAEDVPTGAAPGRTRFKLDPAILTTLAEMPKLRTLLNCAVITAPALKLLRESVPAPFGALTTLYTKVRVGDAPGLIRLLAQARTITDLTLVMLIKGLGAQWLNQQSVRNAAFRRIPPCLPQLQRLELAFSPDLATDYLHRYDQDESMDDNYVPLRYLSELTELAIHGAHVSMDAAALHFFLSGLPKLQRLSLGAACVLPPDALVTVGQCCSDLRQLELSSWKTAIPLLKHLAGVPPNGDTPMLFPLLRSLCWTQSYEETLPSLDPKTDLTQETVVGPLCRYAPVLGEVTIRPYRWFIDSQS